MAVRKRALAAGSARCTRGLAAAIRALAWHDERVIGRRYSNLAYLLWHESRTLDVAPAIVEALGPPRDAADTLFGDSGTVPLMALLTGRSIAANEVDTNVQRYVTGFEDPAALASRIDSAAPRFVLLRPGFGVGGLPEIQRMARRAYAPPRVFEDERRRSYLLFERRTGDPRR